VCKHSGFSYKPNLYRLARRDPKKVFIPYANKIHFLGGLFIESNDSIYAKEIFT
jgi:hypothetical protein